MKKLAYMLLIAVALIGLNGCKDSSGDLPFLPKSNTLTDVTGATPAGEDKPEVPQKYGVLLLAPFGEEAENAHVKAWAAAVASSLEGYRKDFGYNVQVGFTDVPAELGRDAAEVISAEDAAGSFNSTEVEKVMIFRVVVDAKVDRGACASMNAEVYAARDAIDVDVEECGGFDLTSNMQQNIKARIEEVIEGRDDINLGKSVLNITMLEGRDRVPEATIRYFIESFGFKDVRIIDNNFDLFDYDSWWSVPPVNVPGGGRNIVVPYLTTMTGSLSLDHGAMTWDGDCAIYYLIDNDKANRSLNTILVDETAIDIVKGWLSNYGMD